MPQSLRIFGLIIQKHFYAFLFITFLFCTSEGNCQSNSDSAQPEENRVIIVRKIKEIQITNEKRFNLFKDNLENSKKDKFEIWTYTIEGDPIIYKIKFNGESVLLKENNRMDKYGSLTDRILVKRKRLTVESARKVNTPQELISIF